MADDPRRAMPLPFVRHMLLCEDVQIARSSTQKVNIFGLLSTIVVPDPLAFPIGFGFTIYVVLTEGRGRGTAQIRVRAADSGELCYVGVAREIAFANDPLRVYGYIFRIERCELPRAGVYWVEFHFNGVALSREPIMVKVR